MLSEIWPTFALRLTTARLQLRLPAEDELVALARLAADGVHRADERPFLTPWAEGSPEERARAVVQGHWWRLGDWAPAHWSLGLGVFSITGEALGMATLRAQDFALTREVTTSSWLGLRHQGQGFGTEARVALLTLAFGYLGASDATSEVFQDNHASQGVSRKLGYEHDGISRDVRGEEVLVSDRLRLTAARWAARPRPEVAVTGMAEAAGMFGLDG
ncbi:MAG: GNAT family N-acetyltransferase [Actinomycetales bacterium]